MYNFLINEFEGPLDLLLTMIKQSKMDINDIKIAQITDQYVNFIKSMEELNLDIASEYLVMAAELIEIKSRSLLPKKEVEENEEDEINPEEELKRRLLEYQMYKESTKDFRELESIRTNVYTKIPEAIKDYSDEVYENTDGVSAEDLMEALKKILERQNYQKPISTTVTKKELSVTERMSNIRNVLKEHKGKVKFTELFETVSRPYIVVTFLSILEMAKNRELRITQEANFGQIYIESRDGEEV